MSWPGYPEYNDSGVEWLGYIPSGWAVMSLKNVATVFPSSVDKHSHENETPVQLCNYTDVYKNERISGALDFMRATATPEEIRKFTLKQGDTIITKDSETADDIGISAYVEETLPDVLCGYHLSVVRPLPGLDGRFVKRLFDSHYLKASMEVSANGLTRVGLGQYAIDNLNIPLPPPDEQVQIAEFLEAETAKIDALIAKQGELIVTLREDRTATIAHAVTNGMNADVHAVNAGKWLGDIPGHWTITRLRDIITSIDSGVSVNGAEVPAERGEVGVLKTSCVTLGGGVFRPEANKTVHLEELFRVACPVRAGTLIVCRANTADLVGSAGYVTADIPGLYLSDLLWAVSVQGVESRFLHLWMQSSVYRTQIAAWRTGFNPSMQKLAKASLRAFVIALPPVDEQLQIVDFVTTRSTEIDQLIAKSTEVIDVLHEYRAALITDAVTGKIDVRGAA